MHHITFISTIHAEIGKYNAEELYKIIEKLKPGIIFLEAVDETYSEYKNCTDCFSECLLFIARHLPAM